MLWGIEYNKWINNWTQTICLWYTFYSRLFTERLTIHYIFLLSLSTQDTQRLCGACLFVVVTDLEVASFTFHSSPEGSGSEVSSRSRSTSGAFVSASAQISSLFQVERNPAGLLDNVPFGKRWVSGYWSLMLQILFFCKVKSNKDLSLFMLSQSSGEVSSTFLSMGLFSPMTLLRQACVMILLLMCIVCAVCRKGSVDGGWPGHQMEGYDVCFGVLHQALPS